MTQHIILTCPLDGLPLSTENGTARCSSGHAFDWAKEGYLNLLPVHAKQSKDPGDSALMVQARRRFLSAGFYNVLIDAIDEHIPQGAQFILDAGCGEGYYLNRLHAQHPAAQLCGLDISKHAIKAAAKKYSDITWLVASNRQLPFLSHSLDVIICAFGFPVWHEFKRVLKPDGIVIMTDPASDHLIELRHTLYDNVITKDSVLNHPEDATLLKDQSVRYNIALQDSSLIADLIAMTPHQHRATTDAITRACETGFSDLTVHASLRILSL
jgi:23S rRNA (guanine745-N1)-methyltransferase